MTLLPTRAIILPCTSVNICSPTGKDSAQLHWCLFPGNICKLCQSINKQNSLLFFILGSCKCYGQSTASIGNFFSKCCKSLGNVSNIPSSCWAEPSIPVCFGTGGMHRSSEWLEEQAFEVCLVMLYYSWLSALWKIHCSEFSVLLQHTASLEPGEGWFQHCTSLWNTSGLLLLRFPLGME